MRSVPLPSRIDSSRPRRARCRHRCHWRRRLSRTTAAAAAAADRFQPSANRRRGLTHSCCHSKRTRCRHFHSMRQHSRLAQWHSQEQSSQQCAYPAVCSSAARAAVGRCHCFHPHATAMAEMKLHRVRMATAKSCSLPQRSRCCCCCCCCPVAAASLHSSDPSFQRAMLLHVQIGGAGGAMRRRGSGGKLRQQRMDGGERRERERGRWGGKATAEGESCKEAKRARQWRNGKRSERSISTSLRSAAIPPGGRRAAHSASESRASWRGCRRPLYPAPRLLCSVRLRVCVRVRVCVCVCVCTCVARVVCPLLSCWFFFLFSSLLRRCAATVRWAHDANTTHATRGENKGSGTLAFDDSKHVPASLYGAAFVLETMRKRTLSDASGKREGAELERCRRGSSFTCFLYASSAQSH